MTTGQTANAAVTVTGGQAGLVERVQRGMHLLDVQERGIPVPGVGEHERAAERAEALAELAGRRRKLWEQLAEWVYGPSGDVALVFGQAVLAAAEAAESEVRFWTETAQFWCDRANGLPGDDGTGRGERS